MKKIILTMIVALFLLTATTNINAQQLPKPSPLGKVEQIVGLTKLNIEYSRPSVKGRVVFGELVPYNKMWRLGANNSTKLETSTDISIGEKTLPKGKYSVFAIPSKNGEWEIVINSDTNLQGAYGYDKAKDAIRVKSKAVTNSITETLSIDFDKITPSSAVISIKWDKLKVDVPFTIDTKKFVQENIDNAIKAGKNLDKVYSQIAFSYYGLKEYDKAIMYADKSLEIKKTSSPLFTKARCFQGQGKIKKAIKLAKLALKEIQESDPKGYPAFIKKNIKEWSK